MSSSRYKYFLLSTLFFAQGLPYGIQNDLIPAFLRTQEVDLRLISFTNALAIPWVLKFLWAPWVDRSHFKGWGPRRSWIIPTQLGIGITFVLVSQISLEPFTMPALYFLFGCLFVANLFAATQDIAVDGLGVESLTMAERGTANGLQVAMYRVGGITGGGLTMLMLSWISWQAAFLFLALLAVVACFPIYRHQETKHIELHQRQKSFREIYAGFFNRPGMFAWLAVLLLFRAGHSFGTSMEKPFLVDHGLSLADIGLLSGIFGLLASVFGAIVGGFLINQFGRLPMLISFIVAQAFALCLYSYLDSGWDRMWLYVIPVFEHGVGGMATAALFTLAMDVSRKEHAGSDYTIQASLALLVAGLFQLGSGFSAHYFGYAMHFKFAAALALLTLLPVAIWSRTRVKIYDGY